MALRLDGLSVTKPKGLKAGESESESFSVSLVLSWSAALAVTLALLLLLVKRRMWDLGLGELGTAERGEEEGGRLKGRDCRAEAILSGCCGCWSLEVENQRF